MPELPEVESSIRYLKSKVLGRTFVDIWRDTLKMGVCKGTLGADFKKKIKGRKIKGLRRRAKNIIFELDQNLSLLVHYKMTGHLLFGKWKKNNGRWIANIDGPLKEDQMNRYIRFIFFLDDGNQLAFSDLRKFGKIELWKSAELIKQLSSLGIEPLSEEFTLKKFKSMLQGKKGKIKPLIMNQNFIAGIGNIYASDALWMAKIHPARKTDSLSSKEVKALFQSIKKVLREGLETKGDSMVDFRLPDGAKGKYQNHQKVYGREGEECKNNCGGTIKKIKVGGRGTYFCPLCQKNDNTTTRERQLQIDC